MAYQNYLKTPSFLKAILFLLVLSACFSIESFAAKPIQNRSNLTQELPPLVPFRQGDKWGFADTTGKMLIPPQYDEIGVLRNGMFTVKKGNKWGLANKAGKEIIPIKYDEIYDFGGQLPYAAVIKSGKKGYIDTTGQLVVPVKYSSVTHIGNGFFRVGSFNIERSKGSYGVFYKGKLLTSTSFHQVRSYPSGYILLEKFNGKYGLLNPEGKMVFQPEYTGISDLNNGIFVVHGKKTNDKRIFLNKDGQLLFKEAYGSAGAFSEGLAAVSREYNNPNYGYIDTTGKLVIDFQFYEAHPFRNGVAYVRQKDKYGLIDKKGEIIVPLIYDRFFWSGDGQFLTGIKQDTVFLVGHFSPSGTKTLYKKYLMVRLYTEGLIQFVTHDQRTGYFDKNGKEVIPPKFEDANLFSEVLAAVKLNGKWGFIDRTGKIVIPFTYSNSSNEFHHYMFKEGISPVMLDTVINGYRRNKWAYIDKSGKYISDFFLYFQGNPQAFKEGVTSIPVKWKQGVRDDVFLDPQFTIINKEGKRITNELYTKVYPAEEGLIYVCKESGCGFIDTTGEIIIPLQYQFDLTSNTGENDVFSYYFNGLIKVMDPKSKKPIGFFSKTGQKFWQD